MTSAKSPNMSVEVPLPLPSYPRERSWSSIPPSPYPGVDTRKSDASSKDEAKSIGSVHFNVIASDSNDIGADEEIEDGAPVSFSGCIGERGNEEWMIVSTLTPPTQEREDHVDGSIDEVSAILTFLHLVRVEDISTDRAYSPRTPRPMEER
ncbi:hypothetical protein BDV97DRAFT_354180 [Delphinella strobiligena]|nr:hypothetical protein BDV97DRAFT_354180 [Delphinella strobiligena]